VQWGVPHVSCRGSRTRSYSLRSTSRMIRANVMEAMNEDYVRTAPREKARPSRASSGRTSFAMHCCRVVTMLGMDIGIGLGGAIFTETIYNLPGLGKSSRSARSAKPIFRS